MAICDRLSKEDMCRAAVKWADRDIDRGWRGHEDRRRRLLSIVFSVTYDTLGPDSSVPYDHIQKIIE